MSKDSMDVVSLAILESSRRVYRHYEIQKII